ncbi:hypothetical protein J3R82DRAFT_11817 [Butyriboletus roseoflavus]|nr:hypothetical protein J3R82DRAFT_11817 [Butyriboletus roseoflavus]
MSAIQRAFSTAICPRMTSTAIAKALPERFKELSESLSEIQDRVRQASSPSSNTTLVAVSKYKPASDILACYECGQRDFGENYVNELEEKARQLPDDIRWHFIGTLQSNKSKILATIPNIYAIQTVTSTKAASALNKSLPLERTTSLNVLLQVNTSGEQAKSGIPALTSVESGSSSELSQLAQYIVSSCPRLHLHGLMTIGSLTESLLSDESPNEDFEMLKRTRDFLEETLRQDLASGGKWGVDGRLLLSMGMSSDFEAALKGGSDIVRVGTGIFGARPTKEQR